MEALQGFSRLLSTQQRLELKPQHWRADPNAAEGLRTRCSVRLVMMEGGGGVKHPHCLHIYPTFWGFLLVSLSGLHHENDKYIKQFYAKMYLDWFKHSNNYSSTDYFVCQFSLSTVAKCLWRYFWSESSFAWNCKIEDAN